MKKESKVFIISDLHLPFNDVKSTVKLLELIKKEKPTHIVQVGDILDQYVFSRFSRSTKITVQGDIKLGLEKAKELWAKIRKLCPKAKLYQIIGNHDVRLSKRISDKLPEFAELYNPLSMYEFEGVKVLKSDRDFLEIDGVIYCHGWLSKSIDHAKHFNQPTVHGHRHRPTIDVDGRLWSMDVGHLADDKTIPMSYTQSKYSRWRRACGMVIGGRQPVLILL